jgi:hypothetical protein
MPLYDFIYSEASQRDPLLPEAPPTRVRDSRPYRREYSPNSPNKKTNVEQRTTLQGISVCLGLILTCCVNSTFVCHCTISSIRKQAKGILCYRKQYSPNSPNKKTNVEQRTTLQGISVCLWERRNGRGIFKPKGSFVTGSTANSSENTTSISSFPKTYRYTLQYICMSLGTTKWTWYFHSSWRCFR